MRACGGILEYVVVVYSQWSDVVGLVDNCGDGLWSPVRGEWGVVSTSVDRIAESPVS